MIMQCLWSTGTAIHDWLKLQMKRSLVFLFLVCLCCATALEIEVQGRIELRLILYS